MKRDTVKFRIFVLLCVVSILFVFCSGDDESTSRKSGKTDEKIILKVAQNSSIEHPYQAGLEKFKEVLEAESEGMVEVNIFPNGQFGNEEQEIAGVELGDIDATIVSSGNLAPFMPEIDLFNLPFIFRDEEHFYRVLDGYIGEWMGRIIEEKVKCVFLGYCSLGIRNAWNAKKPVLKPDDFKGMKIRVMESPILLSIFNAFGSQATTMSWDELYSALQQGVLDGAECGMVDLLVGKFYEVTKYVSYTNHLFGAAAFIFSKEKYDRLPANVQTAVLTAGRAGAIAAREAEDVLTSKALIELKKKGIEFFNVDKDLFREKVKPVYEKYAGRLGGMELIEQIMRQ